MVIGQHCARLHRLFGQDVSRADNHTDARPARRQPGSQRLHHRARCGIVNAAGKDQLGVNFTVRAKMVQNRIHRLLPQHGRGTRTHMTTAFATFEDEPLCTAFKEQADQARRRYMQEGWNILLFQRQRLIRAASGDQREIRFLLCDHGGLLFAQRVIDKAQNSHAPRPVTDLLLGFGKQCAHRFAPHQRKRQEGQRPAISHRNGEIGHVRNAGHRTLQYRIPGARQLCQRRSLGQRTFTIRQCHQRLRIFIQRIKTSAKGFVFTRKTRREGGVLSDQPDRARGRKRVNRRAQGCNKCLRVAFGNIAFGQGQRRLVVGAPETAIGTPKIAAKRAGFGPVHPRDRAGDRRVGPGLIEQRQLPI